MTTPSEGAAAPEPLPEPPRESGAAGPASPRRARAAREQVLLRLDPQVHESPARRAGEELRPANDQSESPLRRALAEAGRLPGGTGPLPRRGRPPRGGAGGGPTGGTGGAPRA